jgi:hypothetical protein
MKWFKKWMFRMFQEGRDIIEEEIYSVSDNNVPERIRRGINKSKGIHGITAASDHSPSTPSINFQIYPATGGYVAEINFYDEKSDSNVRSLHVIPTTDFSELGSSISKIITLEMLKR